MTVRWRGREKRAFRSQHQEAVGGTESYARSEDFTSKQDFERG